MTFSASWLKARLPMPSTRKSAARSLASRISFLLTVCKHKLLQHLPAYQVFLDDPFEDLGGAGVIPDAFRIHDRDGAVHAHAQAIDLAPVDQRFRACEFQILQSLLQKFPRGERLLPGRALGLGLVCAKENVPLVNGKPERARCRFQLLAQL